MKRDNRSELLEQYNDIKKTIHPLEFLIRAR